jgi:chorismate mutase
MKELEKLREEVDRLDDIIVDALVKRIDCVCEIVKYKTTEKEARSLDRVKIVLDKVRKRAIKAGGYEDLVVDIYKSIIEILTDIQLKIVNSPDR